MEDRVVERPVSPSTTNRSSTNSSNSWNSRDFGKPRRSYYRLFPSVEPTPPASPVSLHHHHQHQQRASLRNSSAGGSCRRRSLSEDNGRGAREPQLPPHVLATCTLSSTSPKDGRKGSLPELPALRTVQEDGHLDAAAEGQLGLNAEERGGGVQAHNVVFDSALGQSTEVCETTAAIVNSIATCGRDDQIRLQGTANGSAPASASAPAVGLGLELPPTSSPDHLQPLSQGQPHARSKPRPNLRIAILEQNIEAKPTPPPKSARHVREDSAESSSHGSMYSQTLLQDGATVRDVRVASVALKQSIVPVSAVLKVRELNVAPHAGRLRAPGQLSPSAPSIEQTESGKIANSSDRNTGPQVPPKVGVGRWADLPSLHSRFSARAATPEPHVQIATPEHSASHAIRPATSQGPAKNHAENFSVLDLPDASRASPPVSSRKNALATARANVAALSNIEVPTWNASFYEQTRTPGSDLDSLSSPPLRGHGSVSNAARTLSELAEQCETLHTRHATLRAQRQQLSSGIIASLKDSRPGSDYGDTILHEQLALAAVSSSIDICFAKLKSLECQREDAIASLITQATTASRVSDEIARITRKSSLTPSLDLETRLTTGRSTPDLHVFYRPNRPGPIQTYSYKGDADTQQAKSPLLPRSSSLPTEVEVRTENNHENTSVRPPSMLAEVHEPPATPESSYETGGTPSTANETDDTQASDLSDIEDMLDEERKPKSPRTDANGNSVKAVKVLGIGLNDPPLSPPPVSPMSILSGAMRKKAKTPKHLRLHMDAQSKAEVDKVSPLTSSTLNADDQDQSAQDLELQLQSFPSAPCRTTALPPSIPPLSFGEPKKTTTSTRRNDSPVQRSDTGKSKASAHTINVYYDSGSHEEDLPPFP